MGFLNPFSVGAGVLEGAAEVTAGIQERKEAEIQARITEREGVSEARRKEKESRKFLSDQEMTFLKSGVMLKGSPLLVLEETATEATAEQENIKAAATTRAQSLRRQGKAAFTSGLLRGGAAVARGFA